MNTTQKKRHKVKEYYGGRIKKLVEIVADIVAKDPSIAQNRDYLHATLKANIPGYGNPEKCFNCERSMQITQYTAGIIEGLLLQAMARDVKKKVAVGVPFTEANKTHIPTLETSDAIRHSVTRASYLGLVVQPEDISQSGHWIITTWGWKALRGEPIPRSVKYWEGRLISRSEETTTLGEMFRTHVDLVRRASEQQKKVRSDYTGAISEYDPAEWRELGEVVSEPGLF